MQGNRAPSIRRRRNWRLSIAVIAGLATSSAAGGQSATVLDESAAPGANYDKAEFRFWYPRDAGTLRGVIVLNPGSNGDGRGAAEDTLWQAFATRHRLALVGTRFTDKKHEQGFIEEYVNVSRGSGQALLDALSKFATRSGHPEIASAPLLLWGMSAGGQFNYEFMAWKPERVAAFVVNKGGIYYSALVSAAARDVPGILFVGGKDLAFRTNTIVGLFAVNRRGGALWALAEEPAAAHVVGRSREMAMIFFDDIIPLRLGDQPGALKPLSTNTGFIGDFTTKTFQPAGEGPPPGVPTAWLPTARVARAWRALVSETPFDP
jgi:poly(3-hydroxybutyrate) depolymerase